MIESIPSMIAAGDVPTAFRADSQQPVAAENNHRHEDPAQDLLEPYAPASALVAFSRHDSFAGCQADASSGPSWISLVML